MSGGLPISVGMGSFDDVFHNPFLLMKNNERFSAHRIIITDFFAFVHRFSAKSHFLFYFTDLVCYNPIVE